MNARAFSALQCKKIKIIKKSLDHYWMISVDIVA